MHALALVPLYTINPFLCLRKPLGFQVDAASPSNSWNGHMFTLCAALKWRHPLGTSREIPRHANTWMWAGDAKKQEAAGRYISLAAVWVRFWEPGQVHRVALVEGWGNPQGHGAAPNTGPILYVTWGPCAVTANPRPHSPAWPAMLWVTR